MHAVQRLEYIFESKRNMAIIVVLYTEPKVKPEDVRCCFPVIYVC
jgi:hypothetical protein